MTHTTHKNGTTINWVDTGEGRLAGATQSHTPAPWDYSPSLHTFDDGVKVPTYAIQDIDGNFIAKLHPFNGLPHESAEVFANAHLIAAAPELLEALERLTHPMADDSDLNFALETINKARGQS